MPSAAAHQLVSAGEYNKGLLSGAFLEPNHRLPSGEGKGDSSSKYNNLLVANPDGLMARLRIPAINQDLPVYHGTSDDTLERGLGHLEGTSLPVGGADTHAVITGHSGLATAELFTHLNLVKKGDIFTIEVFGEVLNYKVINTQIVEPDDTKALYPQKGRDLVTLVTCTPLGINSQRILVTGERVDAKPQKDVAALSKPPNAPPFPWWMVYLGGGVAASGLYVWWSGYPAKPKRGGSSPPVRARSDMK